MGEHRSTLGGQAAVAAATASESVQVQLRDGCPADAALRACAAAGSAVILASHDDAVLAGADAVVDLDELADRTG